MTEFFAMGGYGFYVWGAYGVTALAARRRDPGGCGRAGARRSPRRGSSAPTRAIGSDR